MKNIFEVSLDEKNRILNLHESATKKQYLKEQEGEGDMGEGRDIEFPKSPIFPEGHNDFVTFFFHGHGENTKISFNSMGDSGTLMTILPNQSDNNSLVENYINDNLTSVQEYKNYYFPNSNSFYFPDFKINPVNNKISFNWLIVNLEKEKGGFIGLGKKQIKIGKIVRKSQPDFEFEGL